MSNVLDARLDFFPGDTQAIAPYGAAFRFSFFLWLYSIGCFRDISHATLAEAYEQSFQCTHGAKHLGPV